MSDLRNAYLKWGKRVQHILREPTDRDKASLIPALHPLKRKDGTPMTVGDYLDFSERAWKSKQVRDIIGLLMEAERGRHGDTGNSTAAKTNTNRL